MERKFHVSNKRSLSRVRSARRRPGCIRLFVCPTTGGRMEISVSPRETVFGLKAALARKLRVSPSKISLIYKDKVLKDGCIQDHNILDDSQVTLLPNMESGLSINRSDRSIIQALENLTETQVNDFLSGRSPLMLAIRMGENMVFVQLQLSMLHPAAAAAPQRGGGVPPQSGASSASTNASQQQRGSGQQQFGVNGGGAACRKGQPQGQRGAFQAPASVTLNSASALAEATRCLSQRLNRLHELNCQGQRMPRNQSDESSTRLLPPAQPPATVNTTGMETPPSSPASVLSQGPAQSAEALPCGSSSSARQSHHHLQSTAFPLPPPPGASTAGPSCGPGTTTTLSSVPVGASAPLSPPPSPGAIIDTMRNLGRGIYSGTFQGTLDPSLQDGQGRPRRSINTILHILNDLLVAQPSPPQPQSQSRPQLQPTATPVKPKAGPMQKPMTLLTPPPSPTTKTSAEASKPFLVNQPSTSPVAPIPAQAAIPEFEENPDNALLRGKMQRVQMMLAQRKEQRRTRREMGAPYYNPSSSGGSNFSFSHNDPISRRLVRPVQAETEAINQLLTKSAASHPSPMCVAVPEKCPVASSSSQPSSKLTAGVDENLESMGELQHQHQQSQKQQQQPSGTACRNGGEHPCQTCAYCNPSREQDSLAV